MVKAVETKLVKQVLDFLETKPRCFQGYDVLDYEVVRKEEDEDGNPEVEVEVFFRGYQGEEPDDEDIVVVNFISNDFKVEWFQN